MDIPNQQVQSLPGIGQLAGEAWRVYKQKLRILLGLMLIPMALSLLSSFLQGNPSEETKSVSPLFFPIWLALIIIGLWTTVSLFYVVNNRDKEVSFKEAMANGWPRIIPFFWVSFLTGLISIVGFILLIIPGIIFSVWYVFSEYIFFAEDLRGMAALKRSKELVKGFWWKVLWRFLGFGFIMFLIMIPVMIVTAILGSLGLWPVSAILTAILNVLIAPLGIVYGFMVYENLKRVKGG